MADKYQVLYSFCRSITFLKIVIRFTGSVIKSGVIAIFNENTEADIPITLNIYNSYIICGYCNNSFTLTVGTNTFNINNGDFYITFRSNITELAKIYINPASEPVTISGFKMFNITLPGNYNYSYGFFHPFNNLGDGVTNAQTSAVSGYTIQDNLLYINGIALRLTKDFVSQDTLINLDFYIPFPTKIIAVGNGVPIILEFYHNVLRTTQSIPNNTLLWIAAMSIPFNFTQLLL